MNRALCWCRATAVAGFILVVAVARSVASPPEAKTRAADYQSAVRAVLVERHWIIMREGPGTLSAVHDIYHAGAQFNGVLFDRNGWRRAPGSRLAATTLTFTPQTAAETPCAVELAAYTLGKKNEAGKMPLVGPQPLDNPGINQSVQGVLEAARKRLVRQHPEYGAR